MNIIKLNDYFNDLDNLTVNNIEQNLKKSDNLQKLISFFILNNIKFYHKIKNNIYLKNKDEIYLLLNNLKNKYINNIVIKLLKCNDLNFDTTEIEQYLLDIIIILNKINNNRVLFNLEYNNLNKIFNSNSSSIDYIAKYKGI